VGIDELDASQIPARVAKVEGLELSVPGRNLEAHAFEAHGAVALALSSGHLAPEGAPQGLRVRCFAPYVGGVEVAAKRRGPQLTVGPPVVVPLHPGLGGIVERPEGELVFVLEHGEQAVLDVEPEVLLLGVLVGRVWQCGSVDDAEASQALNGLVGQHRTAVVGHQRPRKSPLLDGLREPMGEALGAFAAVPLNVAGQARVVVEHAQHLGPDPASLSDQDLARGLVVVKVPEAVDVRVVPDVPGREAARLWDGAEVLGGASAPGASCNAGSSGRKVAVRSWVR